MMQPAQFRYHMLISWKDVMVLMLGWQASWQ